MKAKLRFKANLTNTTTRAMEDWEIPVPFYGSVSGSGLLSGEGRQTVVSA
jgi:hypothetical protein